MSKLIYIATLAAILSISKQKAYAQLQEQELKSVLIERFSRFITWQESSHDTLFIIDVLGNKEMYETIKKTYSSRSIKGKPVEVRYLDKFDEKLINKCHVLYVGDCFLKNISNYTKNCQEAGALVIGHEPECEKIGTSLYFITRNNKVFFSYDPESIKRDQVDISYKLLQLAVNDK